jgi:hypothetical protein
MYIFIIDNLLHIGNYPCHRSKYVGVRRATKLLWRRKDNLYDEMDTKKAWAGAEMGWVEHCLSWCNTHAGSSYGYA